MERNARGIPRRQFLVSVKVLIHLSRKSGQSAVQNEAENAHLCGHWYSLGTGPSKMPARRIMVSLHVAQCTFAGSIVWNLLQV